MREKLQTFGKAMLVPLSLIAIGGLLLGMGGAMTAELTVTSLGFNWATYQTSAMFAIFSVIKTLGGVIFSHISVLYAIGVAFSLSRNDAGWAAFSAFVAYITMHATINILLSINGITPETTTIDAFVAKGFDRVEAAQHSALFTREMGYFTYRTGIFGGILIGVVTSLIHKKFYNVKLPLALAFFSGNRCVPVLSLIWGAIAGAFFSIAWPAIGNVLGNLSVFVYNTGLFGTFIFTLIYEMLVPFGLHPLLSVPMRWTELGGSMMIDGQLVVGNAAIQLAQLASPEPGKLLVRAFMSGYGVIDYAIFPGIALAMYHTAKPEQRKTLAALLVPAIVATIFFGITEPILFTFLFIAPWLYFGIYAPLAGLGSALSEFFQVSVYQGNIKDLIPFLFRPEKLYLTPYLFILPAFFAAAYFSFKVLILKFNILTPGRDEQEDAEVKLYSRKDFEEKLTAGKGSLPEMIIENLGGKENIVEVDNCISRLRVIVHDLTKVSDDAVWVKKLKASGVIRAGKTGIQIVYGPKVAEISSDVRTLLGN
ncbi:MAG: PTS transporter subunit EIIC [Brevinema sp.]